MAARKRSSAGPKKKAAAIVRKIARAAKKPLRKKAARKRAASTVSRLPASTALVGARAAPRPRPAPKRSTVDDYVLSVPAPMRAILAEVRQIVRVAEPAATEAFKWGQPVFELNGPFAWTKAFRGHVGFGFFRGAELSDPQGLLEGAGKGMRHVKLRSAGEIPVTQLEAFVRQAAALNRAK